MEKFISLMKHLIKNWSLSLDIPHGYFEINNLKTSRSIGLSKEKKEEYLQAYIEKVKEIETYMSKTKFVDECHQQNEYARQRKRLSMQMLLLAYQDDILRSWGGSREGSGRPATGRKRRQYYLSDDEDSKIKEYIVELRGRD